MRLRKAFRDQLVQDKTINRVLGQLVDEYTGKRYPAIGYQLAYTGMPLPYMVIRKEPAVRESQLIDRVTYLFEVFGENAEEEVEIAIARVAQLFHRADIMPYGAIAYYDGSYNIDTSDNTLVASGVRITARIPRADLHDTHAADNEEQIDIYIQIKG